jgi:hypothetical protein
MTLLFLIAIAVQLIPVVSESQTGRIIPCPLQAEPLPGEFTFNPETLIIAPGSPWEVADLFAEDVRDVVVNKISVAKEDLKKEISFLSLKVQASIMKSYVPVNL